MPSCKQLASHLYSFIREQNDKLEYPKPSSHSFRESTFLSVLLLKEDVPALFFLCLCVCHDGLAAQAFEMNLPEFEFHWVGYFSL